MAKRRIIWSPRAKLDLFEILDFYYKRNGNKIYSNKLNSAFQESVRLLAQHSDIGVLTDIQNIRNLIAGNYSVIYRIKSETIEIVTIWDNRQDQAKLFVKE
jgi:plasmid stabilization system protein ParE